MIEPAPSPGRASGPRRPPSGPGGGSTPAAARRCPSTWRWGSTNGTGDAFASVLGAAIALRLFLFTVPAVLFSATVVMLVAGRDGFRSLTEQAGLTGDLASQVDQAARADIATQLWLLAVSGWLTVWAGRALTKVLAACSAGAWSMAGRQGRATFRMAASVTTLVFVLVLTAAIVNRLERPRGSR